MSGSKLTKWGGVSLGVLMFTGCFSPSDESRARLVAIETEGKQMEVTLDEVEERLLGNQAMLQSWQELGRRHREVTQLHCAQSESHLAAIVNLQESKQSRARRSPRNRMASSKGLVRPRAVSPTGDEG